MYTPSKHEPAPTITTKPGGFVHFRLILCAIILAFFVAVAFFALRQESSLDLLAKLKLKWIPALAGATLLGLWAQGYCTKVVTHMSGQILSFREWFGLKIIHLSCNYIIPFSGLGFRGYYLKRLYAVPNSTYLASIGMKTIMQLAVYSACGAIALLAHLQTQKQPLGSLEWTVLGGITVIFVGALVLFFLPTTFKHIPSLARLYTKTTKAGTFSAAINARLLVANILEYLTFTLTFFVAASAFNIDVPLSFAFVSTTLASYSFLIRITPASIGVYEASIALSSHFYGIPLAQSLMISGSVRLMTILAYLILTPIFGYHLASRSDVSLQQIFKKSNQINK